MEILNVIRQKFQFTHHLLGVTSALARTASTSLFQFTHPLAECDLF